MVDLVLRAVQRRRTTAARLLATLEPRRAHRWRRLLRELLAEAADGVHSALELRYLRDVERPHGLPRGVRNAAERAAGRPTRYRDVRYPGLVVELDGREAHPDDARFRDRGRDNGVTLGGERTLRYGWREVAADPCAVAAQVAAVLRRGRLVRPHETLLAWSILSPDTDGSSTRASMTGGQGSSNVDHALDMTG